VVKFGPRDAVQRARENYDSTVAPLDPRHVAMARWSVFWRGWAAIAYRLVQPARQREYPTLADRVLREECTPKDEAFLIGAVFDGLKPWHAAYAHASPRQNPEPLVEYWTRTLWGDSTKGINKLEMITGQLNPDHDERFVVQLNGERDTINDPVRFVLRNQQGTDTAKLTTTCVVHGDLHARNILVVGSEPCIIDCAQVHDGHPLRDFATLETSLRFDAMYSGRPPEDVWRLEGRLVDPFFEPSWKDFDESGWKGKTVRLTHAIRYRAWLLKPPYESTERWRRHYALCLLFCLLKNASIDEIPGVVWPARQKLAYCAAGKLVELAEAYLKVAATSPDAARFFKDKDATASPSA